MKTWKPSLFIVQFVFSIYVRVFLCMYMGVCAYVCMKESVKGSSSYAQHNTNTTFVFIFTVCCWDKNTCSCYGEYPETVTSSVWNYVMLHKNSNVNEQSKYVMLLIMLMMEQIIHHLSEYCDWSTNVPSCLFYVNTIMSKHIWLLLVICLSKNSLNTTKFV